MQRQCVKNWVTIVWVCGLCALGLLGCSVQLPAISGSEPLTVSVDSETAAQAMSVLEEMTREVDLESIDLDKGDLDEMVHRMFTWLDTQTLPIEDLPLRLKDAQNDPELLDGLFAYAYETVAGQAENADMARVDELARQLFGVDISGAPSAVGTDGVYARPESSTQEARQAAQNTAQAAESAVPEMDEALDQAASLLGPEAAQLLDQAASALAPGGAEAVNPATGHQLQNSHLEVGEGGQVRYSVDLLRPGTDRPEQYAFHFTLEKEGERVFLRFQDVKKS